MDTPRGGEWEELCEFLSLVQGIAIAFLEFSSGRQAEQWRLSLAAHGIATHEVVTASPEATARLAETLLRLELPEDKLPLWITLHYPATATYAEKWLGALDHALASCNQTRNLLTGHLLRPILFVGTSQLTRSARTHAPDLWSIRRLVLRIPPNAVIHDQMEMEMEMEKVASLREFSTNSLPPKIAPDPAASTAEAEAALGRGDQAAALRSLARALAGASSRGDDLNLEAVFERILPLLENSDDSSGSFARTLLDIGSTLENHGRSREMEFLARRAIEITDRLPSPDPTLVIRARLHLGDSLVERGQLPEASEQYFAAITSIRQVADAAPKSTSWQRDFFVAYNKLGDVARASGDLEEATRRYNLSLDYAEKLVAIDPRNLEWQRDLSICYNKLGDVARSIGDLAEAARRYEFSLAIRQKLATLNPQNLDWQRDLSVSYIALGDIGEYSGDLAEAAHRFSLALANTEKIAIADPGNMQWQRDLVVAHNRLADIARATGNLTEAAQRYDLAHRITEKLAAADPGNLEWQRDLSISQSKLGDVAVATGDLPEAGRRYAADLSIAEKLVAADPTNMQWQRDLTISHSKLATVAYKQGKPELFIQHLQAAYNVLADLESRGIHLSQQDLGYLEMLGELFPASE